jgi:DNA replication and repair protein RecF
MRIESLQLQHYRSIADQIELDLHPRLTIFLGPNGSGKTNILEAISLLSIPRSFRGSKDGDLIAWQADFARVAGRIASPSGPERELVVFMNGGKKLQMDGQAKTVADFLGQFLDVLFAPEDVDLLAGAPSNRRSFIDSHLSLLSPAYLTHLVAYSQVLSRRNRLLSRAAWPDRDDLEYWNDQQRLHGTAIIESRLEAVDQLNIALPPDLRLHYTSSLTADTAAIAETFHHKQANILEREKQVGHTLLGPQRDDWRLELTDQAIDLGRFGSRGQQRMGVIALKRAQLHIMANEKAETAVLLLDDVLSELDATNQQLLINSVGQQQTIMTSATLSDIPNALLTDARVYEFDSGHWSIHKS